MGSLQSVHPDGFSTRESEAQAQQFLPALVIYGETVPTNNVSAQNEFGTQLCPNSSIMLSEAVMNEE